MMHFADGITITTLVENYVDMLIPNTERVKRPGLAFHFDPRNKPIQAENGISMLVDISFAGQMYRILFDAGLSDSVILHNMSALKISPDVIDHAVISHGHPDHYGGLLAVLKARSVPLPVIIHPNAFLTRYVVAGNGWVIPYYNQSLRKEELEAAGGRLVLAANPVQIGPAAFTTGEIPLKTPFEPPGPPSGTPSSLRCLRNGKFEEDETADDLALVVCLKDKGLVVIAGCAHAGIINTIRQAQAVTGVEKVHAIFGGFHLGFPGIPEEKSDKTIEELKRLKPAIVSPMHCSGFKTLTAVAREMPEAFLLNTAGAQITL
jgi:7,8-dihydropterin-6-yl-methyl-4-(beta-D-ribofuranosyl)aminobenzene 5'-phosphate synthase